MHHEALQHPGQRCIGCLLWSTGRCIWTGFLGHQHTWMPKIMNISGTWPASTQAMNVPMSTTVETARTLNFWSFVSLLCACRQAQTEKGLQHPLLCPESLPQAARSCFTCFISLTSSL